jgi:Skp family chaperone for outer membrane proteins
VKSKAGILLRVAILGVAVYLGSRLWAQTPTQPTQPAPTRIGIINMVEVVKNYKKAQNIEVEMRRVQADWENKLKPFRDQANALKAKYQSPMTSQQEREQVEKDVRKLQMESQALEDDAKKDMAKRSGDVYKQLYREVEDAVNRFAASNGYAVVFFMNDGTTADDKYSPQNVARKFSLPAAAVPIYVAPQVDITAIISNNLNMVYQASAGIGTAPAAPAPRQ